jgi:hypothetical protein
VHTSCGQYEVRWHQQQQATAPATATPVRVFSSAGGISRSRELVIVIAVVFGQADIASCAAAVVVIVYAHSARDDLTSPGRSHWDLICIDTLLLFPPNSTVTPSVCTFSANAVGPNRTSPASRPASQPASQPCCQACRRKTHISPFCFYFLLNSNYPEQQHGAKRRNRRRYVPMYAARNASRNNRLLQTHFSPTATGTPQVTTRGAERVSRH